MGCAYLKAAHMVLLIQPGLPAGGVEGVERLVGVVQLRRELGVPRLSQHKSFNRTPHALGKGVHCKCADFPCGPVKHTHSRCAHNQLSHLARTKPNIQAFLIMRP